MTKDAIIDIIDRGVSAGTLTVDDLLIHINRILEKRVKILLEASNNKISFLYSYPRMVSCCFSQVYELDVKEIRLEKELVIVCEDPATQDIYELNTEDFLMGELRHVLDKIEKMNMCTLYNSCK